MHLPIRGLCLLALVLLPPADARADALAELERQQEALFERAAPSVVFVSTPEGLGSGFLVSNDGLVLTNAHVVGDERTVRVVTTDGQTYSGTVVKRAAHGVDLALVRIAARGRPALILAEKAALRVGAWVATIGHSKGGVWSFNSGMVSNIYPDGAEHPVFQTQIPLNPGASGGPIFDARGGVVGIVTARLNGAEGINFAIRSDVALAAFPELSGLCECVTVTVPAGVTVFVNGRMAGVGPRLRIPGTKDPLEISAVIGGTMKKATVRYPDTRTVELR